MSNFKKAAIVAITAAAAVSSVSPAFARPVEHVVHRTVVVRHPVVRHPVVRRTVVHRTVVRR